MSIEFQIAKRALNQVRYDQPTELPVLCQWRPEPDNEPQTIAYELSQIVDEMGYGGQAGGGKTDLGLGLAGTKHRRSLYFRYHFTDLLDLIERGNEIYPAPYIAGFKRHWRFGGRIVRLAAMSNEDDWKKYRGGNNDLIIFDEAEEFSINQITNVTGWSRTTHEGQHTLVLFLFNPPTKPEAEWLLDYFKAWLDPEYPNPAEPCEIRYFATIDGKQVEVESKAPFEHDGLTIYPVSRTFVPASRHDNPHLGEKYEARLQALREPLRSQLLFGDFKITFASDASQVIPTEWIFQAQKRWREMECPDIDVRAMGVDVAYGGGDNTVIAKLYDNYIDSLIVEAGSKTPDGHATANLIYQHYVFGCQVYIDIIGYGASAFDIFKTKAGVGDDAHGFNASHAVRYRDKVSEYGFTNARAYLWWKAAELLNPANGYNIALPDDRLLRAELATPRYKVVGKK